MEFFNIQKIQYEGRGSKNPFAFKWYDENQVVMGKSMKEYFRFAAAYWHSFCGKGNDPFGSVTRDLPWDKYQDALDRGKAKMDAAFQFFNILGLPYYCFHDVDFVDEADDYAETDRRMFEITKYAKQKQAETGVKLLWGTANLTGNRRYMNGAATNPDFNIVAHAAAQVKRTLDMTIELGGENYVFWGGREGYLSLLNTDMKREKEHLAKFLTLARDYGRKNGFSGVFLVEPKPMEPMKHQYDYDAETVIGFLRRYNLADDFKLNIEVNHATLAGHTFQHDVQCAIDAGLFGSIDANRGDYQNGWDTDQFPVNIFEMVEIMLVIAQGGGFKAGGINFDAKVRRNSVDMEDLFIAHVTGMDAFARALITAEKILNETDYLKIRAERYSSFNDSDGRKFENGELTLDALNNYARKNPGCIHRSGKQELMEQIIFDSI